MVESTEALVSEVTEEIGNELVPATPVDTGFARANWRASLNAPAAEPVSFLDPSGQSTMSRIATVGLRYRVGETVFIINRAPYIGSLNAGSSPQASAGFVNKAVRDGMGRAVQRIETRGLL